MTYLDTYVSEDRHGHLMTVTGWRVCAQDAATQSVCAGCRDTECAGCQEVEYVRRMPGRGVCAVCLHRRFWPWIPREWAFSYNTEQYSKIFSFRLVSCMSMFCLHVCMCTTLIPGARGVEERMSDPLELELEMFMSHHSVLGIRSSARTSTRNWWSFLSCCRPRHLILVPDEVPKETESNLFTFISVCAMAWQQVEVREQRSEVSFLLPSEAWGLNLGT